MKRLEKDRTRRYETSSGLAADIRRHLNEVPVDARPPSTAYRMQKFVRRHKGPVAAAAALVTALVLGGLVALNQAWRAEQAQAKETQLRKQAQA